MFVVFSVSSINKPDCYDITETESSMEHTNGIKEPFLLEGVVSPTYHIKLYCVHLRNNNKFYVQIC
jgi:hypothetical protein